MSATLNQVLTPAEPDAPDADEYADDQDALHVKLVRWFEEAERSSYDARALSERDRAYFDGEQWTRAELEALRLRGQPPITINKIADKIQLLCGLERKARTDPKAFPRTPTEEDRAEAATQALRFIDDDNNYPVIRSAVFANMLIEGVGAVEVGLEDDGQGGADITLTHVSWERLWWDPHSRAIDFADARYRGLVVWMDRDQCEEMYPDAAAVIGDAFSPTGGSYDDRPALAVWSDNRRERVRVAQCHWTEKGEWWSAHYTKAGILSEPQRSKFKDRRGASACPLLMQSAYINADNWRYGAVRNWISLQDEINKRRSKALHLLSVHQVVAEKAAVDDVDHARRQVARPDGYIEVTPGMKFEILPGGDLATGQFQLLQHATSEMQLSGPNAAMSGTDPRELSGRAILAQQAGGAVQNEPLADSRRMFSRRVYEMCWMAAREHWRAGKWVRVTDQLNDTRWVGINRAITLQDELAEMPEEKRAAVMQRMMPPLRPGDPRLQQVIRVENDITDLDVDISIEEGANLPTMEAENFQTLVQLAGMQPGLIPGDVLIAASSLRNKEDLLTRMKQHMEAQQQQEQQQAPLRQAHAVATVQALQAKGAADAALAKERNISFVHGLHDMHAEFAAPPYGQPFAAPPDAPSAPGTVGPASMVPHASGGLVTRTLRDQAADWSSPLHHEQYTGFDSHLPPNQLGYDPALVEPNAREYQGETRDNYWRDGATQPPQGGYNFNPPHYLDNPTISHAAGGPITPMSGGDPSGPDDGYITAKAGEYVLNRGAVARYGQPLLDAINAGEIDPKVMQMAAAHALADLRAKHAKAAVDEAKAAHEPHRAVNTIAATHQIHQNIMAPPEPKGTT